MTTQQLDDTDQRREAERLLANPQGPDDRARAYVILGVLSEREQDWQAAVANYSRALAAVPHHPHTLYFSNNNLGYSLIQQSRFDEAEDYCVAAIEVDEQRHNAHKNLGLVYQGQGRWLDAAFCFAMAYRRNPRDPRAWHHLEQLLQTRPNLLRQHEDLSQEIDGLRQMIETGGCAFTH